MIGSQIKLFVTTFLTSLGAVGLGSWINSLTFILDSLGLPLESVNLYLATLPFTAGFQSMVSVIEIASLSLFITLSCRNMIVLKWGRILKNGLMTLIPIFLIFFGIKLFNPLPEIKNETKSIYELNISSSIPIKIHKKLPEPVEFTGDTFDRILTTKTIRVGYNPSCAPFCFLNVDGNVVGYDIAFAYDLAYDLGCQLELVPLDYDHLIEELNGKYYDIAMSAVTINESRLKALAFTQPYITSRLILVVKEKMKKQFTNIDNTIENKKIKIAVLKGSSFEAAVKEIFPGKEVVCLDNYDQFESCDPYVALLWEEMEATAWALCHRNFRIVFHTPPLGFDSLAYPIRGDSQRFLHYLDQWLELKKSEGFTEKQYDLWIKGKTEIAAPVEPRWSIIRNVLHWVD
jgi:ABC-type amino acid transport substrate-binding protein